jgi:hypothetical protein
MGGNWRQAIGSRSSCALVHIVSWQPQVPATGTAAAAGAARHYSNQLRLSTRLKKSRFTVKGKARHVDTGTAPCHRAGGSVQGRASGVHLKYRYRESSNFNNCLTRGLGLESAVSTVLVHNLVIHSRTTCKLPNSLAPPSILRNVLHALDLLFSISRQCQSVDVP